MNGHLYQSIVMRTAPAISITANQPTGFTSKAIRQTNSIKPMVIIADHKANLPKIAVIDQANRITPKPIATTIHSTASPVSPT